MAVTSGQPVVKIGLLGLFHQEHVFRGPWEKVLSSLTQQSSKDVFHPDASSSQIVNY